MTSFASAAKRISNRTVTANGEPALRSTGSAVLDMFGTAGALRNTDPVIVERTFADAYTENKLLATKCMFYVRDVRGGIGERSTFRTMLKYAAKHHPECVLPNISFIGEYGRFDDLYELVGTPCEAEMWRYMKWQLHQDMKNMALSKPVSLLAKWVKTPDASSPNTRKLGILTAKSLGETVYNFKRKLRKLRKYLKVVEVSMSANQWTDVNYQAVPSRAMTLYRHAFERHDGDRYRNFLQRVEKGEAKVNASTLFPYDLIEQYGNKSVTKVWRKFTCEEDPLIEAQWRALPDYVGRACNAMVMADTSGSMTDHNGRPMWSSVGLAIYFAERNRGAFHNLWMSFSGDAAIQHLQGETLAQKLASLDVTHWEMNTNLEKAFERILEIGIQFHVPDEDMVKSLIVISDMQIDMAQGWSSDWTFYDKIARKFANAGYEMPNLVFWNVNASAGEVFHADKSRKGVQLVSGQSAATFKHIMGCVGMTPMEMMRQVLNGERYAQITVAEAV